MTFQLRQLLCFLSADEQRQYLEIEKRMIELLLSSTSVSSQTMRDFIMAELNSLEHTKWEILKNASQQKFTGRISSHASSGFVHAQVGCLSATAGSFTPYRTNTGVIHNQLRDEQQSFHSPTGTLIGERFWAVIIGIDAYPDQPLQGARKDVDAFEAYLRLMLHVPPDHIYKLVDHAATRNRIMDTIYGFLRNNDQIQRGDAIIVYFSGHGTSYAISDLNLGWAGPPSHGSLSRPPSQSHLWEGRSYIQALAPVDRGSDVPDISGRELNVCLADIRDVKGNNITVILDCCYSGGGTRSPQSIQGIYSNTPSTITPNSHSQSASPGTVRVRYTRPLLSYTPGLFNDTDMMTRRLHLGLAPPHQDHLPLLDSGLFLACPPRRVSRERNSV